MQVFANGLVACFPRRFDQIHTALINTRREAGKVQCFKGVTQPVLIFEFLSASARITVHNSKPSLENTKHVELNQWRI